MAILDEHEYDTGVISLASAENNEEHFGLVSASSGPKNKGVVTILLRTTEVDISETDGAITITLTEDQSNELEKVMRITNVRIAHLRALHKFGLIKSTTQIGVDDDSTG